MTDSLKMKIFSIQYWISHIAQDKKFCRSHNLLKYIKDTTYSLENDENMPVEIQITCTRYLFLES